MFLRIAMLIVLAGCVYVFVTHKNLRSGVAQFLYTFAVLVLALQLVFVTRTCMKERSASAPSAVGRISGLRLGEVMRNQLGEKGHVLAVVPAEMAAGADGYFRDQIEGLKKAWRGTDLVLVGIDKAAALGQPQAKVADLVEYAGAFSDVKAVLFFLTPPEFEAFDSFPAGTPPCYVLESSYNGTCRDLFRTGLLRAGVFIRPDYDPQTAKKKAKAEEVFDAKFELRLSTPP